MDTNKRSEAREGSLLFLWGIGTDGQRLWGGKAFLLSSGCCQIKDVCLCGKVF